MDGDLSHRRLDINTWADICRIRYRTNENEPIVERHRHPLRPAFSDTHIFPFGLVRQADLDDVAKQGNLCVTTVVDHPFDAESLIVAFDKCFAQFTQETSVASTAVAEPEA